MKPLIRRILREQTDPTFGDKVWDAVKDVGKFVLKNNGLSCLINQERPLFFNTNLPTSLTASQTLSPMWGLFVLLKFYVLMVSFDFFYVV